jgi:phosphatidylinositol alpha 1,6-mannosyltransferase
LDLVENSRTGWLYKPGDLAELRSRVMDLMGDDAKRRAFASAAHASVQGRTWPALCGELVRHYREVIGQPVSTTSTSEGAAL